METTEFSLQLIDLLTPFLTLLFGIMVALWVKEFAVDIVKGLSFKYFGPFREGDHVMLDDHKAVIVKIGLTVTVFGCDDKERGYIWRYIPNNRIGHLKLGKVISSHPKKV
jgi:small-conductance mechanosensitive channel